GLGASLRHDALPLVGTRRTKLSGDAGLRARPGISNSGLTRCAPSLLPTPHSRAQRVPLRLAPSEIRVQAILTVTYGSVLLGLRAIGSVLLEGGADRAGHRRASGRIRDR